MVITKTSLLSHTIMIMCSLVIGYSLWFMLARNQIVEESVTIPVIFYSDGAPIVRTSVNALVQGARFQLASFMRRPPRVALSLASPVPETAVIKKEDILLPETLTLIKYAPETVWLSNTP